MGYVPSIPDFSRKIDNFFHNSDEDTDVALLFFLVLTFVLWAPTWVISKFFGYIVEFINTSSS